MAASTDNTNAATSAAPDDRPPSPARRRRHRDSIAMNFRPPTKELYHPPTASSLTDHTIPDTEQQPNNDSLRDLQAMLHDVADWDAKREEQQQNIKVSPAQKEAPKQATEQSATTIKTTTSIVGSRSVRFHQAVVHYHPRIIGDNPACTSGVPLSIDWKALHTVTRDLTLNDEEEKERTPLTALYLSPQERRSICHKELGLSLRVIHQACKPVNIARSQRRRTLEMLPFAPLHEQLERIQRKLVCQSSNSNTSAVAAYWEQQQQQQQQSSASSSSQQRASFLRRSSSNKSSNLSAAAAAVHSNTQKNASSAGATTNLDHTQSTVLLDDSSGASASQHSPRIRTSVQEAADLRFSRQRRGPVVAEEEAEA